MKTVSPFTGVVFATPTFGRTPCLEFTMSMMYTDQLLGANGIGRGHLYVGGDPYISHARNKLATMFLKQHPDINDFFFLDDDIGWPAEAVMKLLASPYDVVAGVYPKKKDQTEFPCELAFEKGGLVEQNGFYKANLVPTGFLRIKRHVLERIAAESGVYMEDDFDGVSRERYNIFHEGFLPDEPKTTTPEGNVRGKWWGEDYYFAAIWRSMGGEIWIYPDIAFTHRGQRVWSANFNDSVKAFLESNKIMEGAKNAQPA